MHTPPTSARRSRRRSPNPNADRTSGPSPPGRSARGAPVLRSPVSVRPSRPTDGPLPTDASVLVLQHPAEFRRRTFSTVPLLGLVMRKVTVKVGYSFDAREEDEIRDAVDRGDEVLLLFPGPKALELDDFAGGTESDTTIGENDFAEERDERAEFNDRGGLRSNGDRGRRRGRGRRGRLLVLVDGTWNQARRMVRESPSLLSSCTQIQFSSVPPTPSLYDAIRKEPEGHCLSTLEAIAKALSLLEPDKEAAKKVESYLHSALKALVDGQMRQMENPVQRHVKNTERLYWKNKRRREIEKVLFDDGNGGGMRDTEARRYQNGDGGRRAAVDVVGPADPTRFAAAPRRELPNGAALRPLVPGDAPLLNSRWEHRSKRSLAMIRRRIAADDISACLGIETVSDVRGEPDLVASVMRYENGAIGMLHVEEGHRRKGYGSLLLEAATEAVDEEREEVFAFVLDGNEPSERLFTKLGWVKADPNAKRGTGKRRAKRKWVRRCDIGEGDDSNGR